MSDMPDEGPWDEDARTMKAQEREIDMLEKQVEKLAAENRHGRVAICWLAILAGILGIVAYVAGKITR
jgi:hypothetical protein